MLKVYGRNNSSNVQKVIWALHEMGVDYERIDAGGTYGMVDTPEYKAMNPNSRVPTIDEDGFILWESNAILRYLAAKHDPGGLCPSDARARAEADSWMDWQQTTIGPCITPIFWNLVRLSAPERDRDAIEKGRQGMIALMAVLDALMAGRDYIMGDRLTMADIPLGIAVYRWLALIEDRPKAGNVEAWYDRLAGRAAFRANVLEIPLS